MAHPWWDSNPRPPDYMPSIHMYVNAYTYIYIEISVWVAVILLPDFFFANIYINIYSHAKQTQKVYI